MIGDVAEDEGKLHSWIANHTCESSIMTTGIYNDSNWHHVFINRKNNTQYLYIDGELVGIDSEENGGSPCTANIIGTGVTTIGNYPDSYDTDYFFGIIDEIKVHNRALSSEEINASYDNGLYRLNSNFTDLEDGTYVYTAYAQDVGGNINNTETRTLYIDTILTWSNLVYDDLVVLNENNTITINVMSGAFIDTVVVEHNNINYTGTNVSDLYTITYNMTSTGNVTDTVWMNSTHGHINTTTFTYNGADINITYFNSSESYMMPNATGYDGMFPMNYNPPITIFYNNGNGSDVYVNVTINTTVDSCLNFYLYNESISDNSVKYQAHKFTSPSTTHTIVSSMSNNTNITIYGWCDFINCVSGNSYYYEYWFDYYNK